MTKDAARSERGPHHLVEFVGDIRSGRFPRGPSPRRRARVAVGVAGLRGTPNFMVRHETLFAAPFSTCQSLPNDDDRVRWPGLASPIALTASRAVRGRTGGVLEETIDAAAAKAPRRANAAALSAGDRFFASRSRLRPACASRNASNAQRQPSSVDLRARRRTRGETKPVFSISFAASSFGETDFCGVGMLAPTLS